MSTPIHHVFISEATELLADLEKGLLLLERSPSDKESISQVFRTMHTLKGSAKMFGFDAIDALTHQLETIYESIRSAKTELTPEIFDITLAALDHLRNLLDSSADKGALQQVQNELLSRIEVFLKQSKSKSDAQPPVGELTLQPSSSRVYYISFLPGENILKNGTNTLYLIEDLLAQDQGLVLPYFRGDIGLAMSEPMVNYTAFEIVLATSRTEHELRDVFMFVEGECDLVIRQMPAEVASLSESLLHRIQQGHSVQVAQGYEAILHLLLPHTTNKEIVSAQVRKDTQASVRVPSERLDDLMNLVSELVTTQAQLRLFVGAQQEGQLAVISESMEKITRRLRDNAFGMSLIPIESLVVRFKRLVRDLSKELNKEILFNTEGTETEIDKSIIERLADPILHLLRNALDHGIELPEERIKKGKPKQGSLMLKAYYSGSMVVIEIVDDGSGIHLGNVKRKAVQNGIIEADAQLSEKEITDLIFLPGFSTAQQITGVSGRGVGMDVVKRSIADLRGEIEIITKEGSGTTFRISLPLTLSIIEGLLVTAAKTNFILPLSAVRKCYEIQTSLLRHEAHQQVVLDGERIPVINLCEAFSSGEALPARSQVITVSYQGNNFGLAVETIVGEYQAVLKPLGDCYKGQSEYSGATILGDGSVALIIDTGRLIRKLVAAA